MNKVIGNFYIVFGKSFSNGNMYVYDFKNYWDMFVKYIFIYEIYYLCFGL